jgi:acyl-coenzyme A thioesterase PaaI-like protein
MENGGNYNQRPVTAWNELDFFKWAGLRLIEVNEGVVKGELLVEAHHRGGGGSPTSINGGIVSYMFDALLGAVAASTWDNTVIGQATVSLNIHYLNVLEAKERVRGEARIIRGGGSLVYCEGRVWGDSGTSAATCTGIFRIFRRR